MTNYTFTTRDGITITGLSRKTQDVARALHAAQGKGIPPSITGVQDVRSCVEELRAKGAKIAENAGTASSMTGNRAFAYVWTNRPYTRKELAQMETE